MQEHKRNPDKDYRTEAVVFTTSNNSFGPTEISYLENRFWNLATDAKRYMVKNSNDPAAGHITEEKESELEEFIDYAKIVMGTRYCKRRQPQRRESGTADEQVFCIKRNNTNAKSRLTSEGIVVLAGSVIRKDLVPNCPDSVKTQRKDNKNNIDGDNALQKDILFKTPSGASSFVLGASSNGNIEWRTGDGRALKDVG